MTVLPQRDGAQEGQRERENRGERKREKGVFLYRGGHHHVQHLRGGAEIYRGGGQLGPAHLRSVLHRISVPGPPGLADPEKAGADPGPKEPRLFCPAGPGGHRHLHAHLSALCQLHRLRGGGGAVQL